MLLIVVVCSDAVTEISCNLLVSHSEVILSKISEIMLHHVRIVSENIMQCTMRLSIELENFQILKSKGLVFAQF